jgi:hypothetical protein
MKVKFFWHDTTLTCNQLPTICISLLSPSSEKYKSILRIARASQAIGLLSHLSDWLSKPAIYLFLPLCNPTISCNQSSLLGPPWRYTLQDPPKRRLLANWHGVISQTTLLTLASSVSRHTTNFMQTASTVTMVLFCGVPSWESQKYRPSKHFHSWLPYA